MKPYDERSLSEAIITRAWTDEAFRQELLRKPKSTIEKEFKVDLPKEVQLEVLEETASSRYLVLPFRSVDARKAVSRMDWAGVKAGARLSVDLPVWFEFSGRIQEKASADDAFRQELIGNPKAALEKAFGLAVPDFVEVKTMEENARNRYLVLPYRPEETDELLDEDLEAVAGGESGVSPQVCTSGGSGNC